MVVNRKQSPLCGAKKISVGCSFILVPLMVIMEQIMQIG